MLPFPSRGAISIGPHDSASSLSPHSGRGRPQCREGKNHPKRSIQCGQSELNPETQLISSIVSILLDHPVHTLSLPSPFLVTTAKYLLCSSIQPVTLRRRIIIVQSGLEEGGREGEQ